MVKLRVSLYGLRKAPQLWYKLLARTLQTIESHRASSTDCFFVGPNAERHVYLFVFFNDIVIVGDPSMTNSVKRKLSSVLKTTDFSACTHLLGIKIETVDLF